MHQYKKTISTVNTQISVGESRLSTIEALDMRGLELTASCKSVISQITALLSPMTEHLIFRATHFIGLDTAKHCSREDSETLHIRHAFGASHTRFTNSPGVSSLDTFEGGV